MYPERAPQAVAEQWLRLGPGLIVVTCGPSGAMAIRGSGLVLHRPAYPAEVIDTAGVGDAFTAALLGAMHRLGDEGKTPRALTAQDLAEVLDAAILAAAMTCERPGADPPTATELHWPENTATRAQPPATRSDAPRRTAQATVPECSAHASYSPPGPPRDILDEPALLAASRSALEQRVRRASEGGATRPFGIKSS